MAEHRRWTCPQCQRAFKLQPSQRAPDVCPECRQSPAALTVASQLTIAARPGIPRARFGESVWLIVSLTLFGFIAISMAIVFSAQAAQTQLWPDLKSLVIAGIAVAFLFPGLILLATAVALSMLRQIEANTRR